MLDTNKKLSHKNWAEGGTHVTNFSSKHLLNYAKAIEAHQKENPNHGLIISAFAYKADNKTFIEDCCSLHDTKSDEHCGLDGFWIIYDSLAD